MSAKVGTSFDAIVPTRVRSRRHTQADRREQGNEAGKQHFGWLYARLIHQTHTTRTRLLPPACRSRGYQWRPSPWLLMLCSGAAGLILCWGPHSHSSHAAFPTPRFSLARSASLFEKLIICFAFKQFLVERGLSLLGAPTRFPIKILEAGFLRKHFAKMHHVNLTEGGSGTLGHWRTEGSCRTDQEQRIRVFTCSPCNAVWLWLPTTPGVLNCTDHSLYRSYKRGLVPHLFFGQLKQKRQKL